VGRLGGRAIAVEVKTRANAAPYPEHFLETPIEAPATYLLRHLTAVAPPAGGADAAAPASLYRASFSIDRLNSGCLTPRRNADVDAALRCASSLRAFADRVRHTVLNVWLPLGAAADPGRRLADAQQLTAQAVLMPFALFTPPAAAAAAASDPAPAPSSTPPLALGVPGGSSALLDRAALNALLAESSRALEARCAELVAALPAADAAGEALSGSEARLLVCLDWAQRGCDATLMSVEYVESMLHLQLMAAVGKVLQPSDFDAFMRFHARKLLAPSVQPRPLCFSVRRSAAHAPEGVLQIVAAGESQPISTVCCSSAADDAQLMSFPLSAEASVQFAGERHLHAWLAHSFSGQPPPQLTLLASARQFSSFVLLVGRLSGARSFDPVAAVIVRDKDELRIPLRVAALPSPKEFKDAVASLSPEQAAFARAFRAMQLECSVFALLALQIKPQLELLLGLEAEALVKEVQLSNDLIELFIKDQVPSDLLSFGGAASADGATRLAQVKAHVAAIREMIDKSGERLVAQRKREEEYAHPSGPVFSGAPSPTAFAASAMMMPSAFSDSASLRPMMMRRGASNAPPPPSLAAPPAAGSFFGAAPAAMAEGGGGGRMYKASEGDASASPPPQQQRQQPKASEADAEEEEADAAAGGRDLTRVPAQLDAAYERLDLDHALRAATIAVGGPWERSQLPSLLSRAAVSSQLHEDEQQGAKAAAFDLLDALSRGGALPMRAASLHVVVGAAHSFDESLMDTLVQRSVNPIQQVERSTLILASVVHDRPAAELVRRDARARLEGHSPLLFGA